MFTIIKVCISSVELNHQSRQDRGVKNFKSISKFILGTCPDLKSKSICPNPDSDQDLTLIPKKKISRSHPIRIPKLEKKNSN